MMDCPCGQPLKIKAEESVRTRESVDVRSCPCGKIKEVVIYGEFDKVNTAHDKFKLIAEKL